MRMRRWGFTLTELMVAVLILVVVIVATSKIFGTVSRVTGVGEAGAAVLQEAAAIERQIRSDFERLSREGFFMIRCVAVPNDINLLDGGPLLNPALLPGDVIRADQLIFFVQGVQSVQTLMTGAGTSHKGQGAVSRVYYGHAFQVPAGPPVDTTSSSPDVEAFDPKFTPLLANANDPVLPWSRGGHDFVRTVFESNPTSSDYGASPAGQFDVTQPPATKWLLARQAIVLANDTDNIRSTFLSDPFGDDPDASDPAGNRSATSIAHPVIVNGRVDAAASQLNDIRAVILSDAAEDGLVDHDWIDQQVLISRTLFYPRAERIAPGMHRIDQALTNNALANACSSFVIDWTYADGVGRIPNSDYPGVMRRRSHEQVWLGLFDFARGVMTYDQSVGVGFDHTVLPINIEPNPPTWSTSVIRDQNPNLSNPIRVYEAIFGYNQDMPLDPDDGQPWDPVSTPAVAYTPWPTSIRITMTLHDADLKLERGREIEFVINLPDNDR